ncbi:MAG: ABC transporter ATP-binding protein, partial [Gammaproteobacteria bacterium]|nr:ABC transporter ATP-binding protein [Gammaproteobacteria bacterium]
HKSYGAHDVLKGLDLDIKSSDIVGLVGLNGSGKTTTIECLLGLQRHQKGSINVLGTSPNELFLLGGKVSAVFDQPCLYPGLTVRQSSIHTKYVLDNKSSNSEALEGKFRLTRYRKFKTKRLSFGNKRRTAILQALIGSPKLIIFDEPFIGLDAEGVEDVLNIIQQENSDNGTTFLLASHQLPYLERICSHVAILHGGTIAVHDKLANLLDSHAVTVRVRSDQCDQIAAISDANPKIELLGQLDDDTIELRLQDMSSSNLNELLVQGGASVSELAMVRPSLNSLFRSITSEEIEQDGTALQ